MPFTTVFPTAKVPFKLAVKMSVTAPPSRVAAAISTSAGELTRVGTFPAGGLAETRGKTWYSSTSTLLILDRGVPAGINPIIAARLMTVVCVKRKSSAVSVSSPGPAGRDSAPSRPSGLPVLKKKGVAPAGVANQTPTLKVAAIKLTGNLIAILHLLLISTGIYVLAFWPGVFYIKPPPVGAVSP